MDYLERNTIADVAKALDNKKSATEKSQARQACVQKEKLTSII